MDAVEFIRTIQKLCEGADCDSCPLNVKNGCNVCYAAEPEQTVRIVEEWAAEQECKKAEQEQQKTEQEKRLREMEEQIKMLREQTQVLAEARVMYTNKIDALQEITEKAREEIRLVDAYLATICADALLREKKKGEGK